MRLEIPQLLMLAQFDDESGRGMQNLIILLVFVALSALSGFLKRRQDKSAAKPKKTSKTLFSPPPARPITPVKKPDSPTSRIPQSFSPKQTRPTQPAPRKVARIPSLEIVKPKPEPTQVYPLKEPPRPKTPHPAHSGTTAKKTKTSVRIAAQKQIHSTAEAAKLQKAAQQTAQQVKSKAAPESDKIQLSLDQQDKLVHAILYAEILNQPMALRPTGSHEFLSF